MTVHQIHFNKNLKSNSSNPQNKFQLKQNRAKYVLKTFYNNKKRSTLQKNAS